MKTTLRASTGAKILVWREQDTFYARRAHGAVEPQICLAVDLFEVIAELAGLNLEQGAQALEAIKLADDARRRLQSRVQERDQDGEDESAQSPPG